MLKRPNNSGWRRFLYTRTAIIIVALIGLLVGRAVWQVFWKQRLVFKDRAQVESELAGLTARETKLRSELDSLKSASGLEEKIREKFSVVKEGERVIEIVTSDTVATGTATTTEKSWWPF